MLLPNHIDQDHFEGKLAEVLKTTKEAIHYEVERLNEKKSHAPSSPEEIPLVKSVLKPATPETAKLHTSLLTYITGVLPLVQEASAIKIREILELITGKTFTELEDSVPAESRAEVLFRTETFLDKNPRKVFDEEFIHALNQFRSVTARRELTAAREKLVEAESLGNFEEVGGAIERVSKLQQILQMAPYDTSLLK